MRMNLTEILILFLFGITNSSAQINGNSKITARLNDGSSNLNSSDGFLELSVDGVNWYMLCDDSGGFDSTYFKVASVVCKQLGYGPPVLAENHFKSDFNKDYLQYNDDWCSVNTTEVLNCSLEGSSSLAPDRCIGRIIYVECLPAKAEENNVALARVHRDDRDGLVLVHINEQWGPICRGNAGDAVCQQLGFGPKNDFFSIDGDVNTYASYVLGFLFCGSTDETVEECSRLSVTVSSCDPDSYVRVSCMESDYFVEDDPPEDGSIPIRPRYSNSYLSFFFVIIIVIGILTRVFIVRSRAQQRRQNPVRATGVPSLSSNVNQQQSAPSTFAAANYPRQQTQSSTFQGYPPSGTQAISVSPYPPTVYQSPGPPFPPPANDSDLPSYDDVVRNQTPTKY